MDGSCMRIGVCSIQKSIIWASTPNSGGVLPALHVSNCPRFFPVGENQQGAMFSHHTVQHVQPEGCT